MKTLHVLLVEDDPAQADLLLECSGDATKWTIARDGDAALKRLHAVALGLPDLVLLDLNLPGLNGHEVLRHIRSDVRLRLLPVVVFSHSDARRDIVEAYANGANSYITKPPQLAQLIRTVGQLEQFWCEAVTLPPKESA